MRLIYIVLFLPLSVFGQGYLLNPYRFEQALLLDEYPGAVAAFSLRKLDKDYTGNCIRVRRSSDNAEQNIGFVGNYLDTVSLKIFCAATNGFVTTWYDQSASSSNGTQGSASLQPQIVSAGSLLNGIVFSGDFLPTSNLSLYNNVGYICASILFSRSDSTLSAMYGVATPAGLTRFSFGFSPLNMRIVLRRLDANSATIISTALPPLNSRRLAFCDVQYANNTANLYINASLAQSGTTGGAGNTSATNSNSIIIGSFGGSDFHIGTLWEIIVYNTNQASNRTGIQSNVNNFYTIY